MNYIVEEMLASVDNFEDYLTEVGDDELMHIGMPRRSGRYPWGSGDNPYQRSNKDFISRVEELKKNGWKETPEMIMDEFGISSDQYRTELQLCKAERKLDMILTIEGLRKKGLNNSEIGRELGKPESSIRSLSNPKTVANNKEVFNTADFIRKRIEEDGMIEVGKEVHRELGVSENKFKQALLLLEGEGYPLYTGSVPNVTNPGRQLNQKVICPPGTEHKEIYNHANVHSLTKYTSRDGGNTFTTFQYPASLDSKRMKIRYAEEGGLERDGLIEIRRGVKDLSLGNDHYSQVRILVDNDRYLKGMAVYSDNLPDGVDIVFNTNKTKDVPMRKVLKEIKEDPDNPFGALIKPTGQSTYIDKDGKEKLSLINKTKEEGDWSDWNDALPSQFLSKQPKALIDKQLKMSIDDKEAEYASIMSINNKTIRRHYLKEFASKCDSAAVDLKAAALPGQKYQVIIPINTLKDNEVYAPNYNNGDKLALIRYPHAGTFEIPILTVNNRNKLGKELIGKDIMDAVGINKKIADQLSGADFDGDAVMAIPTHNPNGGVKIKNTKPFAELEGFDPKDEYPEREGMRYMKKSDTQTQMGIISNLITDMTLVGADPKDMVKAVKHSMCVIDAEKHKLDWIRSEKENDIDYLKRKYQKKADGGYGGASTLISRAKGEYRVDKRQGSGYTNMKGKPNYDPTRPEGALIYKTADPKKLYYADKDTNKETGMVTARTTDGGRVVYNSKDPVEVKKYAPVQKVDPMTGEVSYTNRDGTIHYRMKKRTTVSTNMAETDDAYTLLSTMRHPKEIAYADYANKLKAMANRARKEEMMTGKMEQNKDAKQKYKAEVSSLLSKLNEAEMNRPKERAAQRMANAEVKAKKEANPNLTKKEIQKLNQQAITRARAAVGGKTRKERNIIITDKEWEAIQAGAISDTKLCDILDNADPATLRERATPKTSLGLTKVQINRAKSLQASNYSTAEIAKKLGVSTSVVYKYLKGGN